MSSDSIVAGFTEIRDPQSRKRVVATFVDESTLLLAGFGKSWLARIDLLEHSADMLPRQCEEILCIASDVGYLAVGTRDAEILVYKSSDCSQLAFRIPAFSASISCCTVSSGFHSLVFGTQSGDLLFCSLNSGSVIRSVSLNGGRPSRILITPFWGFVAVYATFINEGTLAHRLSLFSINGDLIETTEIESAVVAWNSFTSTDGFDFIAFADSRGNAYIFEAFLLNPAEPIFHGSSQVVSISFLHNESTAALLTEDGTLSLFALPQ
jgi:hypothetical protein